MPRERGIADPQPAVEGVTESLKAREPLVWDQRMNAIRDRAEEIVIHDLICI